MFYLFPEDWSDEKIINATIQVGNTRSIATRPRDNATLHQFQIDGINIEVIKIGDNVTSSYPCGNNCTSLEDFIK
ncbi:EndoU domain-containing protein [Moraxella bovoculi]|uniref:EndoU domain-containing protein n=1 Tax=Moraxella bovoculi TaxID=386891 RepID=UPI001D0D5BC3